MSSGSKKFIITILISGFIMIIGFSDNHDDVYCEGGKFYFENGTPIDSYNVYEGVDESTSSIPPDMGTSRSYSPAEYPREYKYNFRG